MSLPTPRPIVLVVDDELHIRLLLERSLQRAGFPVRAVARGEQALDEIQRGQIGLVILDYEMPGGNGMDTLRAIRALPGRETLPAIMLTGRGQADVERQAAALGVSRFFGKPFSPSELARTVGELLG